MKHFTNKVTNEVFGYESIEDAKHYNEDFDNLVEMTTEQFEEFRNPAQYAKWTISGWIVDEELKRKQQRKEIEQRIQFLRNEIIYLTALDEDASEEIAESKKLRAQLKAL